MNKITPLLQTKEPVTTLSKQAPPLSEKEKETIWTRELGRCMAELADYKGWY